MAGQRYANFDLPGIMIFIYSMLYLCYLLL